MYNHGISMAVMCRSGDFFSVTVSIGSVTTGGVQLAYEPARQFVNRD